MSRMDKGEFGEHVLFMLSPDGFLHMGPGGKWFHVVSPLSEKVAKAFDGREVEYAYNVAPKDTPVHILNTMRRGGMFIVRGVKKHGGE